MRTLTVVALVLAFAAVLLRTAWLQDDAYITFRTVHNFCTGHGLCWNAGERVQTNMHPLWVFVLAIPYALTGEIYWSSLAVSGLLSLLAVLLLLASVGNHVPRLWFAGSVLLLSAAFVDYSTGGLENPLTHLLVVLFAWAYVRDGERAREDPGAPGLLRLGLLAAALLLARYDTLLLVAPPLLAALVRRRPRRRASCALALGLLPAALWLLFATFYFGSPLPSPATAKVTALDIPRAELLAQGMRYLAESLARDPITLLTIAAALVLTATGRVHGCRALAASILLYVGYTVWVGGCFMSGRFFAAPLLLAVFTATRAKSRWNWPWFAAAGAAIALAAFAGLPTLSGRDYDAPEIPASGINDCRGFYFQSTGLLSARRRTWSPAGRVPERLDFAPPLLVLQAVGYQGFLAGSRVHVVDRLALCDPLLSRLPGRNRGAWRIGHVARHLPDGYLATLRLGDNHIADRDLAEYYDHLRIVTRGPLFGAERLATLCHFLCGSYDGLLARYVRERYRSEDCGELAIAELGTAVAPGTPWYEHSVLRIDGPLRVRLQGMSHAERIELGADANDRYALVLLRGPAVVATLVADATATDQEAGIATRVLTVPAQAAAGGYDGIVITPDGGDGIYGVGQLLLRGP
jgi:arabinofuranosyltransferase